jgi:hypothetical protein
MKYLMKAIAEIDGEDFVLEGMFSTLEDFSKKIKEDLPSAEFFVYISGHEPKNLSYREVNNLHKLYDEKYAHQEKFVLSKARFVEAMDIALDTTPKKEIK